MLIPSYCAILIVGLAALAATITSLVHEGGEGVPAFAIVLSLSIGSAWMLKRSEERKLPKEPQKARPALALAWLVSALVAALPLFFLGIHSERGSVLADYGQFPFAFFEAMSGLTSTGLSVCKDASKLPASVQLYRSLLQWLGGIGIILFLAPFIARTDTLADAELDLAPARNPRAVIRAVLIQYLALTLACAGGLTALGIRGWEAINHALTAACTGGFTITPSSLAEYNRPQLAVVALTIWLSGASLVYLLYRLWPSENVKHAHLRGPQMATYLLAAVVGIVVLAFAAHSTEVPSSWSSSAFNWISATSTAGFSNGSTKTYSGAIITSFIVTMLIGSCRGSTGGGIKHARLTTLGAALAGKKQEPDAVFCALTLATSWLSLVVAGAVAFWIFEGSPFRHCLFDAASALGGVGLSEGVASHGMTQGGAIVTILLMWSGRLEIFAVVALFCLVMPLSVRVPRTLLSD